ncbi:Sec-independent protein translocase subunit TatA [Rhodococcus koreensis]|uniref:Sec-independent protein translocase subunit TatA n=1 Tax=Rhodococcus koreensis TaxID=99653 RepID=UPI0036712ABE
MGTMSPWHWAIVIVVLVLLFGSKRLPSAARGLGQSLRIFTSEMKEMQREQTTASSSTTAPASTRGDPHLSAAQPAPTPAPAHPEPARSSLRSGPTQSGVGSSDRAVSYQSPEGDSAKPVRTAPS